MSRLTTKLVLGGLAALAAAGAAVASPQDEIVPTMIVRYTTDALATDSGAKALYRRLARAAEDVCPVTPSNTRLLNPAIAKCRADAIAGAVNKIHNQRLAAVHAAASAKSG
ncbi:MAG TPA: UrcA family protein [Steroidobacteraceae bacterium]